MKPTKTDSRPLDQETPDAETCDPQSPHRHEREMKDALLQRLTRENELLTETVARLTKERTDAAPNAEASLADDNAKTLIQQLRELHHIQRELLEVSGFEALCRRAIELGLERLGFDRLGIWFFREPDPNQPDTPQNDLTGMFGTDLEGNVRDERGWVISERGEQFRRYFERNDHALILRGVEEPKTSYPQNINLVAALRDGADLCGVLSSDNLINFGAFDEVKREVFVFYAMMLGQLCARKKREEKTQQQNEALEARVAERTAQLAQELARRHETEVALRNSEERWKFALEGADDGVWDWNIETGVCFYSARWHGLLGYPERDEHGSKDTWLELLHPDDRETALAILAAYDGKEASLYASRFRMRCADGSHKWILARGKVMEYDADKKPLRMVGTHTDITPQREMEEALRQSEERWKFALEGAGDGVWDWNIADDTIYMSRRWKEMLGYTDADVPNDPRIWDTLVHPEDYPKVLEAGHRHLRNEIPEYLVEYRMKCKHGSYKWILSRGKVIERASDGTPLRAVGTHTDISERKARDEEIYRLNRDMTRRTQQLEAANRELETFSYSVSHDLRAPLRSIDGFSNALLEDYGEQLDGDAQHYMERISAATRRMGHLIDDLLTLSRITRAELNRQRINVTELTQKVVNGIKEREGERAIEWIIAPKITADADPFLLRIALENLLDNAVKFTAKHEMSRIEFGCQDIAGEAIYFVRDDGAGFDMAYGERLFGAFQRLHRPTDFEGTGIGLATVQRIIHKHGGRVWAEAAVEKGATFYFTLQ